MRKVATRNERVKHMYHMGWLKCSYQFPLSEMSGLAIHSFRLEIQKIGFTCNISLQIDVFNVDTRLWESVATRPCNQSGMSNILLMCHNLWESVVTRRYSQSCSVIYIVHVS